MDIFLDENVPTVNNRLIDVAEITTDDPSTVKLKAALRLFYKIRDSKYVVTIDEMFRIYNFTDIAEGIYVKYKMLPLAWKEDLDLLYQASDPGVKTWFNLANVRFLETTETYPAIERGLRVVPRKGEAERVVDEFIEMERTYFDRLNVFISCYVSEIEAISQGKAGPLAKEALGLDYNQVDYIFGSCLLKVYQEAETFLLLIESLNMIEGEPRIPGGRPAALADIILSRGKYMVQAYGPYNARYQVAKKLLENRTAAVANFLPESSPQALMPPMDFVTLWTEIAQPKNLLSKLTLDAVLMTPIRKFPNYKLLIDRVWKVIPADDPTKAKLEATVSKINDFTKQIDDEVLRMAAIENKFFSQLV